MLSASHHGRLFLTASALAIVLAVEACAGTTGTLEGRIRDTKTREPIPGANVSIAEIRLGVTTDLSGRYSLRNIPSGRYTISISHLGFTGRTIRGVVINPDLRTTLDANLDASDVQLPEIVVTQERPLVEHDATGTAYIVSGDELTMLPVQDIAGVMGLKAGTTIEGNVRGGKTNEVLYLVDGLPVQDLMEGGVGSLLPLSSVFGLSLYTGGFDPEYGNALSGIVNVVTRTGGSEHKVMARAENDNLFGFQQSNKTTDAELSMTGPLVAGSLYYAAAARGTLTDTRWWQDLRLFYSSPIEKNFNGFFKLDYMVTPAVRLGAQVLVNTHGWKDYEFPWRYDLTGMPPESKNSNRVALILSHTVSDRFWYTASLSRYLISSSIGDGAPPDTSKAIPWQYDFFLRYVLTGQRMWWARMTQESYTGKVDGTLTLEENHVMKFGGELTLYRLNSDVVRFEPQQTFFGKPIASLPMLDYSSGYRYFPRSGALYIQDKIDVLDQGGLLNLGLRYDFLDVRADRAPVIASVSDTSRRTIAAATSGGLKQSVSPRFGVMFQIDEQSFLTISLGFYTQYPLFQYLYTGLDRVALSRGVSALTGNPSLEPERTQMWEVSYKRILPLDLVVSVTYFKKSTTNLIDSKTFVAGDSKTSGSYGFAEFVNDPYGDASGIEIAVSRARGELLTGDIAYTYMTAQGTSGSEYQGFNLAQYGLPLPASVYPLSWDQRHAITATLHLQPIVDFETHLVAHARTGRPYTYYPTSTGFQPIAGAGLFSLNNARMPGYANIDVVLAYSFRVPFLPSAKFTLTCDVRNLFNAQNVAWMDSNGRIGGELFDPSGYFIGRRTRVGLRVSL